MEKLPTEIVALLANYLTFNEFCTVVALSKLADSENIQTAVAKYKDRSMMKFSSFASKSKRGNGEAKQGIEGKPQSWRDFAQNKLYSATFEVHGRIVPAKLTIPEREMSLLSSTQTIQILQLALNEIQFLKMELRERDQAFRKFMTKFEKLERELKSLRQLIETLKIPLEVFEYAELSNRRLLEKFVPSDPKVRTRVMSDQRDIFGHARDERIKIGRFKEVAEVIDLLTL